MLILDKFNCFVFLLIVNQSISVNIPHNPAVNNFNIPMPISPIINLSIPKVPKKIDTNYFTPMQIIYHINILFATIFDKKSGQKNETFLKRRRSIGS